MQTIEEALNKLEKSKFRSGFSLSDADYEYLEAKGMDTIRRHAVDFVHQRLSPAYPEKDGRQTPMRGHPFLRQCTQRPAVAAGVFINGIGFPPGAN